MSVEITFEPAGLTGLVAEGSYIDEAARRMGLRVFTECAGSDKCRSCIVTVIKGQELLSAPSADELALSATDRRLACQTRLDQSGEVVIKIMSNNRSAKQDPAADFRKGFQDLPLKKKLATLMQLEVTTMIDAFDEIANRSTSLGEKLLDQLGKVSKNRQSSKK